MEEAKVESALQRRRGCRPHAGRRRCRRLLLRAAKSTGPPTDKGWPGSTCTHGAISPCSTNRSPCRPCRVASRCRCRRKPRAACSRRPSAAHAASAGFAAGDPACATVWGSAGLHRRGLGYRASPGVGPGSRAWVRSRQLLQTAQTQTAAELLTQLRLQLRRYLDRAARAGCGLVRAAMKAAAAAGAGVAGVHTGTNKPRC